MVYMKAMLLLSSVFVIFLNVLCGRKFNKTVYSQLGLELSDFRLCSFELCKSKLK